MKKRLAILAENKLKIGDIQAVIATMSPLEGAVDFLHWLRSRTQIIVVSDTFVQFAGPLMAKLEWPTLFCHTLSIAADGSVVGYQLRQKDSKREAVISLRRLNYDTIAVGDSYNDVTMLKEADHGILFRPPENVKNEFPEFPLSYGYDELKQIIAKILSADGI
jgi:phosphoserine/homoserine phosphotransferase